MKTLDGSIPIVFASSDRPSPRPRRDWWRFVLAITPTLMLLTGLVLRGGSLFASGHQPETDRTLEALIAAAIAQGITCGYLFRRASAKVSVVARRTRRTQVACQSGPGLTSGVEERRTCQTSDVEQLVLQVESRDLTVAGDGCIRAARRVSPWTEQ